jgi:DNA-binding transcriptional regulator GbsR (MarR family)
MSLEKIKREFIKFMEEIHSGNPYPRNFYGCLVSIMVETEPVSQERIMELTGFSQATVSLTIQKIQLLFPIRTIKMVGERKHFYEYDAPDRFALDLTKKRTEVQDLDTEFIAPILEKAETRLKKDNSIRRFVDYLKNLLLYLNLIHEYRRNNAEVFEKAMEEGSLDAKTLYGIETLKRKPLSDFLVQLRDASKEYGVPSDKHDFSGIDNQNLKRDYLKGIKPNFNPLYSQDLANQYMVVHAVLLEGLITQEQIADLTQLPRSTISELLSQVEKRGLVKVTKKSGSRVKYYQPGILFSDLMLSYFDRVAIYIGTTRKRLSEFASETKKIRTTTQAKKLLVLLENLEKAYSFAHTLSIDMKVRAVMRLKHEFDSGFIFI